MSKITTWKGFRRSVRPSGCNLLCALENFPGAVLVSGCQRSGTTILARIITASEGMCRYTITADDELDAALVLSGRANVSAGARFCFQTTYMYDCLEEYVNRLSDQKIIWVLRNPYSVICSMLYNWKSSALNELFMGCGIRYLTEPYRYKLQYLGVLGVPCILRACLSYRSKLDEVFYLQKRLDAASLVIVDYDDLVREKGVLLPLIYERIGLAYKPEYGNKLKTSSLSKSSRLAVSERQLVEDICLEIYQAARHLINLRAEH